MKIFPSLKLVCFYAKYNSFTRFKFRKMLGILICNAAWLLTSSYDHDSGCAGWTNPGAVQHGQQRGDEVAKPNHFPAILYESTTGATVQYTVCTLYSSILSLYAHLSHPTAFQLVLLYCISSPSLSFTSHFLPLLSCSSVVFQVPFLRLSSLFILHILLSGVAFTGLYSPFPAPLLPFLPPCYSTLSFPPLFLSFLLPYTFFCHLSPLSSPLPLLSPLPLPTSNSSLPPYVRVCVPHYT